MSKKIVILVEPFEDEIDKNMKNRGRVYRTKQEAIARAKGMLGIE